MEPPEPIKEAIWALDYLTHAQKEHAEQNMRRYHRRAKEILGSPPNSIHPDAETPRQCNPWRNQDRLDILNNYRLPPDESADPAMQARYERILEHTWIFKELIGRIEALIGKRVTFPEPFFLQLCEQFTMFMVLAEAVPPPARTKPWSVEDGFGETQNVVFHVLREMADGLRSYLWLNVERLIDQAAVGRTPANEGIRVDHQENGKIRYHVDGKVVWTRKLWSEEWNIADYSRGAKPKNIDNPSKLGALRELQNTIAAEMTIWSTKQPNGTQNLLDWIAHSAVEGAETAEGERRDIWGPANEDEVTTFSTKKRWRHDFNAILPTIAALRVFGRGRSSKIDPAGISFFVAPLPLPQS